MKLSIRSKIILVFSMVIIMGTFAISWFMVGNMHKKLIESAQHKLESDLAMAKLVVEQRYPGDWYIKNNKIYKGGFEINNGFEMVDLIGKLTGDSVTVFQGDTRVSTNVMLSEGNRAVGTKVSPEIARICLDEKRQYIGKAEVAGVLNQTIYEPITDKNGSVIGLIYVGVPNTPYDKIANEFKTETYIFGLVQILIICYIAWYLSDELCKNIDIIKNAADNIAQGKLNVDVQIDTNDEMGDLAKSFKNMTVNLNEVMTNISIASKYDFLTATVNRRGLMEIFNKNVDRTGKTNRSVFFAIGDIDCFKQFNDTYGHAAGDKVLMELANIIKKNINKKDTVCRWGGEEFVIMLFDRTYDEALLVIENIRGKIESAVIPWDEPTELRATMTFGIAEHISGDSLEDSISKADDALYIGKREGRNMMIEYKEIYKT